MKILFICPGGQTYLNSPSENLAQYINENYNDIEIDIYNVSFRPPPSSAKGYDLVWGDMDGGNVPSIAVSLAKKANIPCYIHGEWVPPWRFEEGWSDFFLTPTQLHMKPNYIRNINAMAQADLVSLAIEGDEGGFEFIKRTTGVEFKNKFLRYPASKKYSPLHLPKTHSVSTIARADDPKKRVNLSAKAISLTNSKPTFNVIGGSIPNPGINLNSLGKFNTDDKIKIFAESKLALQHWSGIPPAEAIQQFCPVISYDMSYMRELYGDALIWVELDNIEKLAETLDYWLTHDKEREEFAQYAYNLFINNKLGVKLDSERAKLVLENLRKIL